MDSLLKTKLALLLPSLAVLPLSTLAQTPAPADLGQRHREDLRESYRIEERIENAKKSYAGVQIDSPQPGLPDIEKIPDDKVLELKQVIFAPEPTVVDASKLRGITDTLVGTKVSMRDLYRMLGQIDAVYDSAGVLGRAVLPVQDIKGGVVTVQLIEARIGKVSTKGGRVLRDWYVHQSVSLKPGDPVRIKPMERTLVRYNTVNESQLQAELLSGANFGETDVVLAVTEPARFSATLFADNAGRKSTGEIRGGLFAAAKSVLGLDETFAVSLDHAEGSDGYSVSYRQPITPWGTFAMVDYDSSKYDIIEGEGEALKVDGDAQTLTLGLSQLLWARGSWSLSANFGYSMAKSETRFEGAKLFVEDLHTLSGGLSLSTRDSKGMWEFSGTVYRSKEFEDRGGQFTYYGASLMRIQWLTPKCTLIVRGTGQYVNDDLVSSRQFQIGGTATVRGFNEGILFGEDGYTGTLELRRSLHKTEKISLEGLAFFDHGAVYNEDSLGARHKQLTGAGIGTNISLGRHLGARIAYAWPLSGMSDTELTDTPSQGRFHCSIQASF